MTVPLVIVDGANVVGSVPDGWWRDRPAAAIRLRDRLVSVLTEGLPDLPGPVDVTLVVEGQAKDIPQADNGVLICRAAGSGDDAITDLVRDVAAARRTVVVTADRELRQRVLALGAEVRGPSSVRRVG
jgi:predicted RNA-binding protein with PIN domain